MPSARQTGVWLRFLIAAKALEASQASVGSIYRELDVGHKLVKHHHTAVNDLDLIETDSARNLNPRPKPAREFEPQKRKRIQKERLPLGRSTTTANIRTLLKAPTGDYN